MPGYVNPTSFMIKNFVTFMTKKVTEKHTSAGSGIEFMSTVGGSGGIKHTQKLEGENRRAFCGSIVRKWFYCLKVEREFC